MKRKEAAFKSMLKQATPPLEPEATWETVRLNLEMLTNNIVNGCFGEARSDGVLVWVTITSTCI